MLLVALLALLAIGTGLWRLTAATAGLEVSGQRLGDIPMTVYRPGAGRPAPVVVIAHGFAGSQQLMQPYAVALARNGYVAVTFDFPGHGRNAARFVARIEDQERRVRVLLGALESVVDFAPTLPGSDGRLALLGHSMAGDVLTRLAAARRDRVAATVLLSPYLAADAPTRGPRNLLILFGALEPEMLRQTGLEAIAAATGEPAETGVTYGHPSQGSARRLELVPGVEHIGVLFAQGGIRAALAWLGQTFDRSEEGVIAGRGGSLALLYLGLLALAWPLSRLLPRAATETLGAGLPWRRLLPVALWPAILTPLILRLLPSDYLPILLGDYLALHFGVYGLLTAVGLWRVAGSGAFEGPGRTLWVGLLLASLAVMAYLVLAIAVPTDHFVTAFMPTSERLWLLLGIVPGTWAYFAADSWASRGPGAPRAGPAATKALFLLSLLGAVALNLRELFFLVIIVPAILLFFLLDGLIGGWVYRRTWHPLPGALGMGLLFAWAITVTFPVVR